MHSRDVVRMLACTALLCVGCYAPTLSKPRGEKHLDALAEAERHQHAGRLSEASQAYERAAGAAERRVDRDESLYRQSRALARMGAYEEAIAICDRLGESREIARRTLRARLDAAKYRLALGERARAERDLRALIVAHPESGPARGALRILLGNLDDDGADSERAIEFLRTLRQDVAGSSLGEMLMNLEAELLVRGDRKGEARRLLERQVTEYPYPKGSRWDDALWRLADLALDDDAPKDAIAYLKRMIAVHESSFIIGSYTRPLFSKAALRIARIYRDRLHDPAAAIDAYAEARSEFPRSLVVDDALVEEAELRLARGQRARGCALLDELLEAHEVGSARRRAQARRATACQ